MILLQATSSSTATDILHLAAIVLMLALLFGGLVGIIVLWYVRGRDPSIDRVAEYIPEPPDDLPPGAAGTLLDERADHSDVVATLLGLARHGAITIHEQAPVAEGRRARADYELEVVDPGKVTSRLERDLLNFLFNGNPEPGATLLMSEAKPRFDGHEREITEDLYREIVARGYFTRSPEATRRRWKRWSWFGLIASIVLGLVVMARTDAFALFPMFAALVIFTVLIRLSGSMPQKTREGAVAASRWRAFRTYLASIQKYENLEEATALFDRYLSYAVAFGLQEHWLQSFKAAGVATPGWFDPVGGGWVIGDSVFDTIYMGQMMGNLGGGGGSDVSMPDVNMPNVGMPDLGNMDLQGMADTLGSGMQDASGGLGGLLDSAGGIFESIDFDFDMDFDF
jgi:hypothetical protein